MQTRKSPLRTLSVLLTVAVLFGVFACLPVGAAEEIREGDYRYTVENGEATITRYYGEDEVLTVPSTLGGYPVTAIGDRAFVSPRVVSATPATDVTIPASVKTIGYEAFYDCVCLKSITIPAGVTEIGEGVFGRCSDLESIAVQTGNPNYEVVNNCLIEKKTDKLLRGCSDSVIPSNVKVIGEEAFSGCSELANVTFSANLESIGSYAFYNCSSITSVTIPANVTSIGDAAFSWCSDLGSITVESGNADYEAVNNCLIEKSTGTLLSGCSNSVIPDGVKVIGKEAFISSDLASAIIPDGVTSIEYAAFQYCRKLTNLVIPSSVKSIEESAFWGCSSLKSVTIPDGVTKIGREAFSACLSLANVTLSHSVTSIEYNAFSYCESLRSIVIPDSVKEITGRAFEGCYDITFYCEADAEPEGWGEAWMDFFDSSVTVVWGYRSPTMLGDPSADGTVNANDYMMLKRHVLHTFNLTSDQLAVADINADGDVNANDYMILKRAVLGTYKLPTE